MAALKPKLDGLARILVSYDLLDEDLAKKANVAARQEKMRFISYVVQEGILSASKIAYSVAQDFGLPLFDLESYDPAYLPGPLVNEKLIQRHHALPIFKRGNQLFLALSDPTNQDALDEFKFNTGLTTRTVLVEENKLSLLIETILNKGDLSLSDLDEKQLEELNITIDDDHPTTATDNNVDDAPIVRFVNKILLEAINKGASDIHFEPYEHSYRVRFRQDGVLHTTASPPKALAASIASRLKIMSQLDISERRIPQDGRFKMKVSPKRSVDFRVSTCPTIGGEKIVMRVLDASVANLGIDRLGYFDNQKQQFLEAINKPQGMVLVTGPTGSGKTVSLYTALNMLNTAERNISTAEDPVEIKLEGVNQVHVNPKTGLTFASVLRSFLRQDPDIIMVGEIRDLETAEIAVKAAQTGHLVLSTLHTNSAPETLTRLINMGIPGFNIATSTNIVVAQRLARRLCDLCKKPLRLPEATLRHEGFTDADDIANLTLYGSTGCDKCIEGYKGRVGLYEVLPVTPVIAEMIMSGKNSIEIAKQAESDGIFTLRRSGLLRVKEGITTLNEINRVTKG